MEEKSDMLAALAEVHEAGRSDLAELLAVVAHAAVSSLEPCRSASVTVLARGVIATLGYAGEVALVADQAQYDHDAGPCLEAARTGARIGVDDIAEDERWPAFNAATLAMGIRSSLSLPLVAESQPLTALNLYAEGAAAFTPAHAEEATRFARHATAALANARALARARDDATHLEQALRSRDLIGQAKGILMRTHQIDETEAFARLRAASQAANRKLRDLAAEVATTGTLPP